MITLAECINNTGVAHLLKVGKVYPVLSQARGFVEVRDEQGGVTRFVANRFVRVYEKVNVDEAHAARYLQLQQGQTA